MKKPDQAMRGINNITDIITKCNHRINITDIIKCNHRINITDIIIECNHRINNITDIIIKCNHRISCGQLMTIKLRSLPDTYPSICIQSFPAFFKVANQVTVHALQGIRH